MQKKISTFLDSTTPEGSDTFGNLIPFQYLDSQKPHIESFQKTWHFYQSTFLYNSKQPSYWLKQTILARRLAESFWVEHIWVKDYLLAKNIYEKIKKKPNYWIEACEKYSLSAPTNCKIGFFVPGTFKAFDVIFKNKAYKNKPQLTLVTSAYGWHILRATPLPKSKKEEKLENISSWEDHIAKEHFLWIQNEIKKGVVSINWRIVNALELHLAHRN